MNLFKLKRWTLLGLIIICLSGGLLAIDFETVFRDLDDPVEVVFVIDTSGSMGWAISGVSDNVIAFAGALADSGYGYRFGTTTLADATNTWDFDTISPGFNMTSDVVDFQTQVAATGASGGGDTPETQIDGIYDAATFYDWAPGTLHVMIMFTNSDFHFPSDGFPYSDVTYSDLITLLIARGFLVYTSYPSSLPGMWVPEADSIYNLIADTTGGCSFILGSKSSTSWETIFDYVRGDIMTYYCLSTRITGLTGYNLDEIELGLLPEMTSFGPRTIDLSGSEYAGVDEIYIGWTLYLTGTPATESPYTITLRTETNVFTDSGELTYKSPMAINDITTIPEAFSLSAHPNPFNGAVKIVVDAPVETQNLASLQIEIFDVNGHRVDVIARRATPDAAISPMAEKDCHDLRSRNDGASEFIWQPAPFLGSGVYLVRARFDNRSLSGAEASGSGTITKRIVYLK